MLEESWEGQGIELSSDAHRRTNTIYGRAESGTSNCGYTRRPAFKFSSTSVGLHGLGVQVSVLLLVVVASYLAGTGASRVGLLLVACLITAG
jgi:hypothetical protein